MGPIKKPFSLTEALFCAILTLENKNKKEKRSTLHWGYSENKGLWPYFVYSNFITTISGRLPVRIGGPQVPTPLEVYWEKSPSVCRP